ncbi:MAG: helix-turn-helix domain-containing protein [Tepidisphaeraceae bacterium]
MDIDRPPPRRGVKRARRRSKSVRLQDVAKASGVSIATVSMVVNHNPRISPATVKRVRRCLDQMGYRPSGWAANVAPGGIVRGLNRMHDDAPRPALASLPLNREMVRGITQATFPRWSQGDRRR